MSGGAQTSHFLFAPLLAEIWLLLFSTYSGDHVGTLGAEHFCFRLLCGSSPTLRLLAGSTAPRRLCGSSPALRLLAGSAAPRRLCGSSPALRLLAGSAAPRRLCGSSPALRLLAGSAAPRRLCGSSPALRLLAGSAAPRRLWRLSLALLFYVRLSLALLLPRAAVPGAGARPPRRAALALLPLVPRTRTTPPPFEI